MISPCTLKEGRAEYTFDRWQRAQKNFDEEEDFKILRRSFKADLLLFCALYCLSSSKTLEFHIIAYLMEYKCGCYASAFLTLC